MNRIKVAPILSSVEATWTSFSKTQGRIVCFYPQLNCFMYLENDLWRQPMTPTAPNDPNLLKPPFIEPGIIVQGKAGGKAEIGFFNWRVGAELANFKGQVDKGSLLAWHHYRQA